MIRKIIEIDEKKCNGCAACVTACHEKAIGMINGKAKLLRDDYCDGLGDCLPVCPTDAIRFIEREALAYDEAAVEDNKKNKTLPCGCSGTHSRKLSPKAGCEIKVPSQLAQWPVQIKLAPTNASYFAETDLLIAADCTAYAYGGFHNDFMKDRITLIGCPKLDNIAYSEKLQEIFKNNSIKSILLTRMEVPCCSGLESSVVKAIQESGKEIPLRIVTISCQGEIVK